MLSDSQELADVPVTRSHSCVRNTTLGTQDCDLLSSNPGPQPGLPVSTNPFISNVDTCVVNEPVPNSAFSTTPGTHKIDSELTYTYQTCMDIEPPGDAVSILTVPSTKDSPPSHKDTVCHQGQDGYFIPPAPTKYYSLTPTNSFSLQNQNTEVQEYKNRLDYTSHNYDKPVETLDYTDTQTKHSTTDFNTSQSLVQPSVLNDSFITNDSLVDTSKQFYIDCHEILSQLPDATPSLDANFTRLIKDQSDIFPDYSVDNFFNTPATDQLDPLSFTIVPSSKKPQISHCDTNDINACFPADQPVFLNHQYCQPDAVSYPQVSSRLPYLNIEIMLPRGETFQVLALHDRGCTNTILSKQIFDAFPSEIQKGLESCNIPVEVATGKSKSNIIGYITLFLSLKSDPSDLYPLLFAHNVFVASYMSKEMYVGSDLLCNQHFYHVERPNEILLKYPPDYKFIIDPLGPPDLKQIPLYYMYSSESGAVLDFDLVLQPHETATVLCSALTSSFQNKFVIAESFNTDSLSYHEFDSPSAIQVLPQDHFVDLNNNLNLTITNPSFAPLLLPKGSLCAKIQLSNEFAQEENSCISFSHPENYLSFLDEDFILDPFPTEIHSLTPADHADQDHDSVLSDFFIPEPPSKLQSKSDFTEKEFLDMFSLDGVEPTLKQKLHSLFIKHRQAFSHFNMDIRKCTSYTHHIQLAGQPQLPRQRPFQHKTLDKVSEAIENLISYGIMERGPERKHYSNFVPVPKPNGKVRLCCDLILLNKVIRTTNKIARMGSPQQLFYRFFNKKVIWAIDLNNAYFHMAVSKFTQQYYGMYSYKPTQDSIGFNRVIQGEKSAVWSWNALMNQLFGEVKNIVSWIDDILIFGDDDEENYKTFVQIVEIVDENGLSIAPAKVNINKQILIFLGFEINKDKGCKQIPQAKVQALQTMPLPVGHAGVNRFLAMLIYYADHIPRLAPAAHELRQSLRNKKSEPNYKWTEERVASFLNIKRMVSHAIVSYFPDLSPGAYFILYCDASYYFYGMKLINITAMGARREVGVYSGEFQTKNLSWTMYMKEFYAVIYATNRYIQYLLDYRFVVYTDCKALIYISEAKIDHSLPYRLAMYLSGFDLEFKHCKGEENEADYLSRPFTSYIDSHKTKPRKVDAIAQLVDSLDVKDSYNTDEVRALLTHNFREVTYDQQRIDSCKNKSKTLFESFKQEIPEIDAKCCDRCTLKIHASSIDFPHPQISTDKSHPSVECHNCQTTLPLFHLPELEKSYYQGHHILLRFINVPFESIFYSNNAPLSILDSVPVHMQLYLHNLETFIQAPCFSVNNIITKFHTGESIPTETPSDDSESILPTFVPPPNDEISKVDTFKSLVFRDGVLTVDNFIRAQNDDPFLSQIIKKLKSKNKNAYPQLRQKYELIQNVLFCKIDDNDDYYDKPKLCMPTFLIPYILDLEHRYPLATHKFASIMFKNISQKYYIPNLLKACQTKVDNCRACAYLQSDKRGPQPYGKSRQILIPLEHLVMDYAVSLPPSDEGFCNILIVMCAYTRYALFYPTKSRAASEILKLFILSYFPTFQMPSYITADNEKSFHEGVFANYMKSFGVMFKPLIPYRPCSAGKVESCVRKCKLALSAFQREMGSRKDWPNYLHFVNSGINNSVHSSLNMSPWKALFGWHKTSHILDILRLDFAEADSEQNPDQFLLKRIKRKLLDKIIQKQDKKVQDINSRQLNKSAVSRDFKVGDKVKRRRHRHAYQVGVNTQLEGLYTGPYTVKTVLDYNLVLLDDATHKEIIESKQHCKLINPVESDLTIPLSTFKTIEKFGDTKHSMVTRSKAKQNHFLHVLKCL